MTNKVEAKQISVEYANCDLESILKSRLQNMVDMALALKGQVNVGADWPGFNGAIEGLINGTAIEIIHQFGMKPEYTNLRKQ